MKLVVFGLTITSSWGNGHATLWRALCKALVRRGHRIVFFEKDVPWYAGARDLDALPGVEIILYPDWDSVRPLAERHLADAGLGMVTSYCPDGIAASELVTHSPAETRVFYDLDTPVTLARLAAGEPVGYLPPQGLGAFDLVLSYTGGAALAQLRRLLGARRVAPLYGSVDPEAHRPTAPAPAYRADLSYLGTYAADRQASLEALLVRPARQLPERRFVIGGAQYPADFPWSDNIHFVRHLPPAEHPAFFSSARLTLNITRQAMAEMGYCPSGRLFEAAACGTLVLSDRWEGLEGFYAPGSEILVASTTEEAMAALTLEEGEVRRMAARARQRTLDEHTADRRARDLEAALALITAPAPGAMAEEV
ncbi:glycosyltransferase [Roseomonas sp. E05]|uniref:CgeB family protein n=1 Tax=Roseomonas sp. E05 TaxID=3046310 RepID=UPI0024BB4E35|nr:glycosyltransferase [Roseomonas sp. E05]MDJ0387700.1 glycosyltransferase [Roseomonas sp. E05]